MHKDVERVLLSQEQIEEIVTRLGKQIDEDYAGDDKHLLLLCILKGSVVFMGDLMRSGKTSTRIPYICHR